MRFGVFITTLQVNNFSERVQTEKAVTYWRWILCTTYGLQILARFGTFRLLIVELVPVQLILQMRRQVFPGGEDSTPLDDGSVPF